MANDLAVRAVHREGMRVDVQVREHVLAMDYPAESGKAPTPLEMLLASLAACAANTLSLVLRRKLGPQVEALEVDAVAQRREEHPTVLTRIELTYRLTGKELDPEQVDQALRMAEEKLCPVYSMLRPGTEIQSRWHAGSQSGTWDRKG
jgi:putative redox protein